MDTFLIIFDTGWYLRDLKLNFSIIKSIFLFINMAHLTQKKARLLHELYNKYWVLTQDQFAKLREQEEFVGVVNDLLFIITPV